MLINFINVMSSIIGSHPFLFFAECFATILKLYLIFSLILHSLKSSKIQSPLFFLILILIGSLIVGFAWIIKLSQILFFPDMDYRIIIFFIRFSWAFNIIQYQSLAFFIESLLEKKFNIILRRKFFILLSAMPCCAFFYLAFFTSLSVRHNFEFKLLSTTCYYLFIVVIPSLFLSLHRLRNPNIPKILKKQLKILLLGLICPIIFSDFIQIYPFDFGPRFIANNYAVVSLSSILIALAAFYCTKKVMRLRFLNLMAFVQSQKKYDFIDKFKYVLEQLSYTTNIQELILITKNFFKEALDIPTGRTTLHMRNVDVIKNKNDNFNFEINKHLVDLSENFINDSNNYDYLRQSKILFYDDIDFSNFYVEKNEIKKSLTFLKQIDADIFIPIYKKQTIVAYIIIEKDDRSNQLYNDVERDEIVVFSSYLGNIIDLLQNKNLETLVAKQKELKEELYFKHREINQYKESIKSFLKKNQQRKIGILFYKNRKFIFGNQDAIELIPININLLKGHSLTQNLKKITRQVEDYKTTQTCYVNDHKGNKLVFMGIPNLENKNIIILVYYPDISDSIKQQIDLLNDPSNWDYLLYLETTKSGQLINQLIPGMGETLLNIKINLLKIALGNGAILLEMPLEDIMATVDIIHYISMRDNLHILKLQNHTNSEIAIKLFGLNFIFDNEGLPNIPLLQKLDNGTLFIENIHFLDLTTQEHLANFIKQGFFYIFKSDQKISSDVRIICSTNVNLKSLVKEGKFSKFLFEQLKNTLVIPSLFKLPEGELNTLAQGYSEQLTQSNVFKNLLELSDKEKKNIINKHSTSLQEFKTKIHQILTEKSKKNNVEQETHFDPAYQITDPKLIEAARLGKHALKDPKTLALLWDKFKNQNKIATFLGVNRSSVHRRFKEYKIE